MLQLEVPEREFFDDATSQFITFKKESLQLEHSLVSLSKWESRWQKPFLSNVEKTTEETVDYIRCMTITQNVRWETYLYLPDFVFSEVDAYINKPMTATWFSDRQRRPQTANKDIITAEIIYYWMIALNIPLECQKWHLNRLFTLIRVCDIKNQPPKKQGRKEMLNNRAALNRARKAQMQTSG